MKSELRECFSQHTYLRESEILKKEALDKMFDKYYLNFEQLSKDEILNGFKILSEMLHKHFNK